MAEFIGDIPYSDPAGILSYFKSHGASFVRSEYTRTRDIMVKRIKRIQEAGYKPDQEIPLRLSELKENKDIAYALSEMYSFLYSQRGSLQGIKESERKFVSTMEKDYGVKIPETQAKEYREFLSYVHAHAKRKLPYTDKLSAAYQNMKTRNRSKVTPYMQGLYYRFKRSQLK